MEFRPYNPEKDQAAVQRIWRETGWIEKDNKVQAESVDIFARAGRALVVDVDGEPECFVRNAPGGMRYLDEELPLCGVCAVSTSRRVRQQGIAARLTAAAMAQDAAEGALVSALGMFEQGYYNRLGFGTGGYQHWVAFDPSRLSVATKPRTPRRITLDDWQLVHRSRHARMRGHGSCNITPAEDTRAVMMWAKNGFGLGYLDDEGAEITHHFWCDVRGEGEHGPYDILWMTYRNREQFLELMGLVRSLGDQVLQVRMMEPPQVQMQDLLERPFRLQDSTEKGRYESSCKAWAYWQARILDLPGCMEKTHLPWGEVRFNLKLTDPIGEFLDANFPWQGCAGEYVVALGQSSGAEPGEDKSLPTMTASVGAFTRLWLGVRSATALSFTDELEAPPALLEALDSVLRLPSPHPDCDF